MLAEPLADDAAFIRKLKPSLIIARAKGQARPTSLQGAGAGRAKPGSPGRSRSGRATAPTLLIVGAAFVAGIVIARSSTGEAMPTHATDTENQTLGGAVKEVAEHAGALARLEIELASSS